MDFVIPLSKCHICLSLEIWGSQAVGKFLKLPFSFYLKFYYCWIVFLNNFYVSMCCKLVAKLHSAANQQNPGINLLSALILMRWYDMIKFKVTLHWKICFAYGYFTWMLELHCAEFDVFTLICRRRKMSLWPPQICLCITTCLEANYFESSC